MKLRPFEYAIKISVETPFLLYPDLIVNVVAQHPDGEDASFFFYIPDPVNTQSPSLSSYDIESALWDGDTAEALRLRQIYTGIYNANRPEIESEIATAARIAAENKNEANSR